MPRSTVVRFAALAAALATSVHASACVAFDASWNLYALNINGADYSLGTQDNWSNGKATALTTTGRPPFTGNNTQCYLSQFQNAIYILDADESNPTDVYIYDATANTWSTQKTTASGADLSSMVAILDHDTNVFFGLSGGTLYQADFAQLKSAQSSAIAWESVSSPSFKTTNYSPVMALAQNHIHFLDVPGSDPGSAYIFVIHFAFFQPDPQAYPASSGNSFPVTHGQTASFFQDDSVQEQFAFIPDDGSATYVVSVQTNTTTPLAGPSDKSSGANYAASTAALVQLTSAGKLFYLPYDQSKPNTGAAWTAINVSGLAAGPSSTTGGASSTGSTSATGSPSSATGTNTKMVSSTARSGTGSSTATSSGTSSTSTQTGAAVVTAPRVGAGIGSIIAALAMMFVA